MLSSRVRDRHSSPDDGRPHVTIAPTRTPLSTVERLECGAIVLAAFVLIATLVLVPAMAQADDKTSGAYFGVVGGSASYFPDTDACGEVIEEINEAATGEDNTRISEAVSTLLGGSNCEIDDSGTAFRLFGGYRFSNWFALEAGLTDLGKVQANLAGRTVVDGVNVDGSGSIDLKVRGLSLSAVVTAPIASRFDIFGRVGVLAWDADATARAGGSLTLAGQNIVIDDVSESASRSGQDLVYGLGMRIGLTDHVKIRAEFNRYEVVDIDVGWIGIEIRP